MRQSIFESANLSVFKVSGARDDIVFVTFEAYLHERAPDRGGFGEAFFERRGFTAYHFLCSGNFWYQHPEMSEALARVRADMRSTMNDGVRIVAYGHSMGAYAAIRSAKTLGAQTVLAFSPQASMDVRRVPWEGRWELASVPVVHEHDLPGREVNIVAFFDPLNLDRRHIRYLDRRTTVEPVRIFFCEHESIIYAHESGLLEGIVLDVATGRLDVAQTEYRLWSARHDTPTYRNYRARKSTSFLRRWRYGLLERLVEWRLSRQLARAAAAPPPDRPWGETSAPSTPLSS